MILYTAYLALRSISDDSDDAFATNALLIWRRCAFKAAQPLYKAAHHDCYLHPVMQLYLDSHSHCTSADCCATLYSKSPGCANITCMAGIA